MKKIGAFHNHIVQKFIKKCEEQHSDNVIERKIAKVILYSNNIPSHLHSKFLKEMEQFKLIKSKNKQNIIILKRKDDDWF